jgi:hypothetical protein
MAQISKGDTFVDGQQVTGVRLNQLVDSSTLLLGAVSEQTPVATNSVLATDTTIIGNSTLKKATIGDILNSNLPVTTSSITGGVGVDIVVTPADTKKFDVAGVFEADSINSVGALTVGGTATVTGTLGITGATTLAGGINGNTTINGDVTIGAGKTLTLNSAPTANLQAATKAYVDAGSKAGCKAWVKFAGATGTISASYNVSSITRSTVGTYTVNLLTTQADANYCIVATCSQNGGLSGWTVVTSQTTSAIGIYTAYPVSYGGAQINYDPTSVYVAIFGN